MITSNSSDGAAAADGASCSPGALSAEELAALAAQQEAQQAMRDVQAMLTEPDTPPEGIPVLQAFLLAAQSSMAAAEGLVATAAAAEALGEQMQKVLVPFPRLVEEAEARIEMAELVLSLAILVIEAQQDRRGLKEQLAQAQQELKLILAEMPPYGDPASAVGTPPPGAAS